MFGQNVRFAFGCGLVTFLMTSSVWAQTGSTSEIESQPEHKEITTRDIVISATKTPQPITQVTSAVEVIDGKEIEEKKIKTVAEALRLAQGLTSFSNGGPGTTAVVAIRGASTEHTLVLIDGVIVNRPTLGEFNFANLTAENIERIEILRGAQGMLYGSDAIGGVINIITRKGTGKPTASAFLEYGSFASLREGAQASGSKGPVDFAFSLTRWDISSFSAINYKRGAFERDGYHNWQASGRLGFNLPKDGRIDLNLRWWNADVDIDSSTAFDVFGAKQTTRTLIVSGIYEQPLTSWWAQKLTLARGNERVISSTGTTRLNINTGAFSNVPVSPLSDIEAVNSRIEWQHNFQVAEPILLTLGYQFREEQADASSSFGSQQPLRLLSTHAGFAQTQLNYHDRVLLTAGLRQDSYSAFGDATTYRVTGGYVIPEIGTKFRGSYATGFHAPNLNQLFFPNFGNPDLKPEKSKSMDVGVDQWLLKDKLQLTATYFWNRFANLIQNVPVGGGLFRAENIGQAKSQGWELGFKYAVLRNLDFRGQYTYTLTRNLSTGRRLRRWPIDQASVSLSYQPIVPVRLNVDYRFVGARNNDVNNTPSQRQGSFGVVNVSGTYDVTRQMQLFGRIENLFNQDYEEILLFGTPIRSVYGGIKITL